MQIYKPRITLITRGRATGSTLLQLAHFPPAATITTGWSVHNTLDICFININYHKEPLSFQTKFS